MRRPQGLLPAGPHRPARTGSVFYTCRKWPDCDLTEDEFIPADQFTRHAPPYCRIHRTTPNGQEGAAMILQPRFRRAPRPPATATQQPPAEPVLMRFLTAGGATVELRAHRFKTRYTYQGRPFASDQWREVDGFTWECLGCGKSGTDSYSRYENGYLPNERHEARDHANAHAESCRAMPKPDGA